MELQKKLPPAPADTVDAADLQQINALAKTDLTPEEVYTFAVRLCDNEIDRDGERFEPETLAALGELFVGKSGIFDHRWSALGQTGRIYRTAVCYEPETVTAAGDGYCYLKGWAYMLRTEKNAALIEEIEGGIKKEVSIGCSVGRAVCSVCGAAAGECGHVHGEVYDGKVCYTSLQDAKDAYEWSFVAVPAQRNAGVMKRFAPRDRQDLKAFLTTAEDGAYLGAYRRLEQEAELGRSYLKGLRADVVRLACVAEEELDGGVFAAIAEKLTERELLELRRVYQKRADALLLPPEVQLPFEAAGTGAGPDGSAFLI